MSSTKTTISVQAVKTDSANTGWTGTTPNNMAQVKNTRSLTWKSMSVKKDGTHVYMYDADIYSTEDVHAKLESIYGIENLKKTWGEEKADEMDVWDWTAMNGRADVFQNHWKIQEKKLLKEGKTQQEIWELEAIGKAERMRDWIRDTSGKEAADEYWASTTKCWEENKRRQEEYRRKRTGIAEIDA